MNQEVDSEISEISSGKTEEDEIFGSRHPFPTLMSLTFGPLLYFLAATFQDAVDLFIVKKGFGNDGESTVSLASLVRSIITDCASFLSSALTIQVSGLIGKKMFAEASQLVVDSIRLAILIGILFPILTYLTRKPLLRFIECPESIIDMCAKYVMGTSVTSIFVATFQFLCASLLGIGKSNLAGFFQITALVISLAIADPLCCFAFKAPIWSLGVAYTSGQIVCSIILVVLFLCGKFSLEIRFNMFIKKPSEFFITTLGQSVQYILTLIGGIIPPLLMLKYMAEASDLCEITSEITSQIFSTFTKPYNVIATVAIGFLAGFTPAASYAFNAKMYKRVNQLFFYALIVPMSIMIVCVTTFLAIPDKILGIWIDSKETLKFASKVRPALYTLWFKPITQALDGLLILTGHSALGALPPLMVFILMTTSIVIFHFTTKNDPWIFYYSLFIGDVAEFVTSLLGSIIPFKFIRKNIANGEKSLFSELL